MTEEPDPTVVHLVTAAYLKECSGADTLDSSGRNGVCGGDSTSRALTRLTRVVAVLLIGAAVAVCVLVRPPADSLPKVTPAYELNVTKRLVGAETGVPGTARESIRRRRDEFERRREEAMSRSNDKSTQIQFRGAGNANQ